jgi:hypothetical protein
VKVGFTGTREWPAPVAQIASFVRVVDCIFERYANPTLPMLFNHGDCVGWDDAAARYVEAKFSRVAINKYPSNIAAMTANAPGVVVASPAPPLERNTAIVGASWIMIACPKEADEVVRSGTWSTVRRTAKANKPLIGVAPNGALWFERVDGSWSAICAMLQIR